MTLDRAALRARIEEFIEAAEDYRIKSETVLLPLDEGVTVTSRMLRARDALRRALSEDAASSEKLKAMVGDGWMVTLERSRGLPAPNPKTVVDAIAALSRVLSEDAPTPEAQKEINLAPDGSASEEDHW